LTAVQTAVQDGGAVAAGAEAAYTALEPEARDAPAAF
jgi:hypothetical protein